ncbi:MAG TPA: hypothetical protein VND65_23160 [Candidatus Binatia bacterium]|nr:hypothetical protein [Candidatus Binatia bacterium]
MTYADFQNAPSNLPSSKLRVLSYDLGIEFSAEHYLDLRIMVEDAVEIAAYAEPVAEFEEVAA